VLASPEKINSASPFQIGSLGLINTVVVEADTDPAWVQAVSAKGITVVSA
jgi:DeoR/GlpR family transcriptional regulator of sugar metabolism